MAELANELLRSITRAFYAPEQIVILDAVLLHSALRDDDLAVLMNQQTKHLRKMCSKLCEDGLLSVHSRAETRQGATRHFNRDYYFVNTHRAIDVVKYRVKSIHRAVEKKYGQTVDEKKEYACSRCKSAYTQMEVLDNVGPLGFNCKRCGNLLDRIEDDATAGTAGHEVQSRLNQQMAVFEKMLAEIDNAEVPEQDFETAIAKALPVKRDENINPAAKTEPVRPGHMPPATVSGLKLEAERVEVSLLDDDQRKAEQDAEAVRKAKFAEQNALPSWHTSSTVGLGSATAASSGRAEDNGFKSEGEDEKKADALDGADEGKEKVNREELASLFAQMEQSEDEDDDDDSDEEEDEEDDEEEETPPEKRVRIEEPSKASQVSKSDDESGESP